MRRDCGVYNLIGHVSWPCFAHSCVEGKDLKLGSWVEIRTVVETSGAAGALNWLAGTFYVLHSEFRGIACQISTVVFLLQFHLAVIILDIKNEE